MSETKSGTIAKPPAYNELRDSLINLRKHVEATMVQQKENAKQVILLRREWTKLKRTANLTILALAIIAGAVLLHILLGGSLTK